VNELGGPATLLATLKVIVPPLTVNGMSPKVELLDPPPIKEALVELLDIATKAEYPEPAGPPPV
jgi:hypothetical protein